MSREAESTSALIGRMRAFEADHVRPQFYVAEARTARKQHKCSECGHSIDAHDRQYGCAEDGCDCTALFDWLDRTWPEWERYEEKHE